ncbi:MAG: rod-binding protein [Candidatus Eremiobacteraeota bacterium]|nr:rod-binding protein [Candidatus Eremiobacteraeota bacterium]
MDIQKSAQATKPALSAEQTTALARLHAAAQQLEGVFVNMLFKAMHATVPKDSIFGKESAAQGTWNDMLDSERAQSVAKSGSFGIAKVLEQQLRSSVLSDASSESKIAVPTELEP